MKMSVLFPALASAAAAHALCFGSLLGFKPWGRNPSDEELEKILEIPAQMSLERLASAEAVFKWLHSKGISILDLGDMEDWVLDEDIDREYLEQNPGRLTTDRRYEYLARTNQTQARLFVEAHSFFDEEGLNSAHEFLYPLAHNYMEIEKILGLVPPRRTALQMIRQNVIFRIDTTTDGKTQIRLSGHHMEEDAVHSWSRGDRVLTITEGPDWSIHYTIDGAHGGTLDSTGGEYMISLRSNQEIDQATREVLGWCKCALGK
jgi:hypothetical protein